MMLEPLIAEKSWRPFLLKQAERSPHYDKKTYNPEFKNHIKEAAYLLTFLYIKTGFKTIPDTTVSKGDFILKNGKVILTATKFSNDQNELTFLHPADFLDHLLIRTGIVCTDSYQTHPWFKKLPQDDTFQTRTVQALDGILQALIDHYQGNKKKAKQQLDNWTQQYDSKYRSSQQLSPTPGIESLFIAQGINRSI